jgi:hypothetical protein
VSPLRQTRGPGWPPLNHSGKSLQLSSTFSGHGPLNILRVEIGVLARGRRSLPLFSLVVG